LFWAGDQLTSWDENDGMQSALRAILSGGLSGMTLSHSDTGGYTEFRARIYNILRTEQMLMRWMEMETFSGAMLRTHPGLLPSLSAQVNSSTETLLSAKFCSKLHTLLHPYRTVLMKQASEFGYPLVRYMFMEFPNDVSSIGIVSQFMLGDMFLIAPIFAKHVETVEVYFPEMTSWTHVFTGNVINGSGFPKVSVNAPIGTPAVFYRNDQDEHLNSTTSAVMSMKAMRAWWKEQ